MEITNYILNEIQKSKRQGLDITLIAGPFLEKCKNRKQLLEIIHVSKLIYCLKKEITILRKSESPDFIVIHKGEMVGLELEQIKNNKFASRMGDLNAITKRAQELFNIKYPDFVFQRTKRFGLLSIRAAIEFNYPLKFTKNCKEGLADNLADLVYINAMLNKEIGNHFVKRIDIHGHSFNRFIHSPNINKTKSLDKDIIQKFISKKEAKYNDYRRKSSLDKQWLLLIAGGVNPDSYDVYDVENLKFDTVFDEVYLLDYFNSKVYSLKRK